MPYDPHRHHRRSIRWRGYDYTCPGAYFITVVTWGRECLFGEIVDGEMQMNELGAVAQSCWQEIPAHFPHVQLDAYVVMPNHIHGIIVIMDVGAYASPPMPPRGPQPKSVGAMVGSFKSAAAKRINEIRGTPGMPVWQRNYYEHIIRNEAALDETRRYIAENPLRWESDHENPAVAAKMGAAQYSADG